MNSHPLISHPRDPLHGITLATIVSQSVTQHGLVEMRHAVSGRLLTFCVKPIGHAERSYYATVSRVDER